MKTTRLLTLFSLLMLTACSSVYVNTDYDKRARFDQYKTFAYLKSGIDKAEISDLDKKRILYALDETLTEKGFSKSENADILISFFTKEKERVDYYNNWGWNMGWNNPWWGGFSYSMPVTSIEGTLIIDVIDAKTKELIWQGKGSGYLTEDVNKKDARIKEFVSKILEKYPPQIKN